MTATSRTSSPPGAPDLSPGAVPDASGFPKRWSIHARREMRALSRTLDALSPGSRAVLEAARADADAASAPELPGKEHVECAPPERFVLALPFPVYTGGMRVLLHLAEMVQDLGSQVHVRQVRGEDCLDGRYDVHGFASRAAVGPDPTALSDALRELAPATVLAGSWMDYLAALRSGAGPVIGYSAGEPVLKETAPFDAALLDFADRAHRLPVALWSGCGFMSRVYRERFGRTSIPVSVPISDVMFSTRRPSPPREPFRVVVVGPEHVPTKGIPTGLRALAPLRSEAITIVWVSPGPASRELAGLVDEVHVDLDARGVAQIVSGCHCLVFPSSLEGLGNPPIEAMARGIPAVLHPNTGCEEYAEPERNCLQVPHGDAEALRAAVRRLRADPDLAARLRASGAVTAQRYHPSMVAATVAEFMTRRLPLVPHLSVTGTGQAIEVVRHA